MKSFGLLLSFLAASSAYSPLIQRLFNSEWETYKSKYNKEYSPRIDVYRKHLYLNNKMRVAQHNQEYHDGKVSYFKGINQFSDMLPHEKAQYQGLNIEPKEINPEAAIFIPPHPDVVIPKSIDWRKSGAVTSVKNQQKCGSCWAFSATGALEGQHFRKTGELVSLSEQNLVDCVRDSNGCDGGRMADAFQYIKNNHGLDTEESYPYLAEDEICHFNETNIGATDLGYTQIESGSEEDLMKAIATVGPVSVSIEVTDHFRSYVGGVFYDDTCTGSLNHGVLAVGYGTTDDGKDYWIVKNSWGAEWGLNGYILMARNRSNNCGIANDASYPLV